MPIRALLRESRPLIIACAVCFVVMFVVLLAWPKTGQTEKLITRKKAEHKLVPLDYYVTVWLRKGWVINTTLAGAMLLASPWLGRRLSRRYETPRTFVFEGWTWKTWLLAGAITGFGLWNTVPRLSHSMWGDEEFNASRYIVDGVTRNDDGSLRIEPRSWTTTLWSFRKTTNHLGFTAVARVFHDTFFRKGTGPQDAWFSETLIRLPVFIAGWCSLLALLWASRVWHLGPGFGAGLMIFHPWFTRFAVDGRAYGFVLLGAPLLIGLLGMAVHTGRWRWWLLLGVTEFLLFWSYFGSVYLLVMLNIAALGLILTDAHVKPDRWVLFGRWFTVNILAAVLVIGLMAPCWPQLFEFLEKSPLAGEMDWPWAKDVLCYVALGAPFQPWDSANPLCVSLDLHSGMVLGLILAVIVLHTVGGLGRFVVHKRLSWLLLVLIGAPALMVLHLNRQGIRPYDWYFVPFLPGLMLIWEASFFSNTHFSRRGVVHYARAVPLLLVLAFATSQHRLFRDHPIEPSRESVALYRTVTNPRNADIEKDIISAGFVMYTEGYDPAMRRFKDVAGLRALMHQADTTHKKLFINVGHIEFAREPYSFPDICRVIEDPAQFKHCAKLHGLLPSTTREVYQYLGTVNGVRG